MRGRQMGFTMLATIFNGHSKIGGSDHLAGVEMRRRVSRSVAAWVEGDGPVWSDLWPRWVHLVQTTARRSDCCGDVT